MCLWFCCALLIPSVSHSQPSGTPARTVDRLLKQLKADEYNLKVIFKYIDWETAFNKINPYMRKKINVSSPSQLRKYYKLSLDDPEKSIRQRFSNSLTKAYQNDKGKIDKLINILADELKSSNRDFKNKVASAKYRIGDVNEIGDSASVEVVRYVGTEPSVISISLIKVRDKWYLPSVQMLMAPLGWKPD